MPVDAEKQAVNRAVWSAGKWDRVADYVAETGPKLLDSVGIEGGMRVLDIGTAAAGPLRFQPQRAEPTSSAPIFPPCTSTPLARGG